MGARRKTRSRLVVRLVGEAGVRTNGARDDPLLPGRNGQFAMLGLIYSPSDRIDLDVGVRKRLNRAEFDTAILLGANSGKNGSRHGCGNLTRDKLPQML